MPDIREKLLDKARELGVHGHPERCSNQQLLDAITAQLARRGTKPGANPTQNPPKPGVSNESAGQAYDDEPGGYPAGYPELGG